MSNNKLFKQPHQRVFMGLMSKVSYVAVAAGITLLSVASAPHSSIESAHADSLDSVVASIEFPTTVIPGIKFFAHISGKSDAGVKTLFLYDQTGAVAQKFDCTDEEKRVKSICEQTYILTAPTTEEAIFWYSARAEDANGKLSEYSVLAGQTQAMRHVLTVWIGVPAEVSVNDTFGVYVAGLAGKNAKKLEINNSKQVIGSFDCNQLEVFCQNVFPIKAPSVPGEFPLYARVMDTSDTWSNYVLTSVNVVPSVKASK